MNTLVITTHDITPAHWADFAKTASCPPSSPNSDPFVPYILLHSPTQQNLALTERISKTIKTNLRSAPWQKLKTTYLALVDQHSTSILPGLFLVLDQQSIQDRKVVVVERDVEFVTLEGEAKYPLAGGEDGLTRWTVWKRYRVPFEEAFTVQCGIEGFCDKFVAEEFLEGVVEREVEAGE